MTGDELRVFAGAICSGIVVSLGVFLGGVHPPRRLSARVHPYTRGVRARLGVLPDTESPVFTYVPGTSRLSRVLGRFLMGTVGKIPVLGPQFGAQPDRDIDRRLRQAGMRIKPDDYRSGQIQWAACAVGLCGFLTYFASGNMLLALLGGVVALFFSISWQSAQVDISIEKRRQCMRRELYPLLMRLGFHLKTDGRILNAVEETVNRAEGEVVEELREVVGAVHNGSSLGDAFRQAAIDTPEVFTARAYRMIANGERTGSRLAENIMTLAVEVRHGLCREAQDKATRRRFTMMVVTTVWMLPVIVLMLAAPMGFLLYGE